MTYGGRVGNYARIDDSYRPQVLGPRSGIATGGDPPSIYLSGRGRNEIRQLSLDGVLLRIIRRTTDPIPVTDRAYQNIVERAYLSAEAMGSPVPRDIVEQMVEREETHPPTAGVLVDPEGYLWVREWSGSESGTPDQWSVFNPEGRWLGVLPFPWAPDPAEPNSCGGNSIFGGFYAGSTGPSFWSSGRTNWGWSGWRGTGFGGVDSEGGCNRPAG